MPKQITTLSSAVARLQAIASRNQNLTAAQVRTNAPNFYDDVMAAIDGLQESYKNHSTPKSKRALKPKSKKGFPKNGPS